jgi:hypothetical protein
MLNLMGNMGALGNIDVLGSTGMLMDHSKPKGPIATIMRSFRDRAVADVLGAKI